MATKGMGIRKALDKIHELSDDQIAAVEFMLGWYGDKIGESLMVGIRIGRSTKHRGEDAHATDPTSDRGSHPGEVTHLRAAGGGQDPSISDNS